MQAFLKLKEVLFDIEADAKKFYEGENNAAGGRLRKAMLEARSLCQDVRNDVTAVKNDRAVKSVPAETED